MGCIYTIKNTVNGNSYIGSTVNFKVRKRAHLNELRKNEHHSIHLQRAYNLYGEANFIFEILEENIERENLLMQEQFWIDSYECVYNMCPVAGSSLFIKRSAETREKCRLAHLGEIHPEWRRALKSQVQSGEKHWAFGKPMREDTKIKKSETMLKKYKEGYIHPRCTPVLKLDITEKFLSEYPSLKEASGNNETVRKSITNCLRGKSKTALGFIWKYKK